MILQNPHTRAQVPPDVGISQRGQMNGLVHGSSAKQQQQREHPYWESGECIPAGAAYDGYW